MKKALSPCWIGRCKVNNRFVMTAANLGWCRQGFVTKRVVDFYEERARGGVGLIIAGAAGVDPLRINQTGMMQIYDDKFIEPMRQLTDSVHKAGSKIFLQLMHAGGYARQKEHQGLKAVAPSSGICSFTGEETQALSETEIRQIIEYFQEASVRAKKAGFDGVELIGSAGYLIAEFLSKATNHRKDDYGGSFAGRIRFLKEIIWAVKEATGKEYPLMVRLSGADFIAGGNQPEDTVKIAQEISKIIDALDITGGWHESSIPQITYQVPRGMYLYLAKAVKNMVSIPVIGCNRMDESKAEHAISHGYVDMAGMLRPLIAEPRLVEKFANDESICPCLSCNQECLDAIFSGKGISCVVNPLVGRKKYNADTKETINRENPVLIVGAGISGMTSALLLAEKGFSVTVWEKNLFFGGTSRAVAKLPGRQEVEKYIEYLFQKCVKAGVVFQWNKNAEDQEIRNLLEKKSFGKVIWANGAEWKPQYKICGKPCIYHPAEYILENREVEENIVIIGSNYKAVQTADYCIMKKERMDAEKKFLMRYAPEQLKFAESIMDWGKSTVTLVSQEKKIGGGLGKSTRWLMLKEIKEKGVIMETETTVKEIRDNQIICDKEGREIEIPADVVIIAEGWKSRKVNYSSEENFTGKMETIGDARRPGRIAEAIKDAFCVAGILKEVNDV